jgi:L-aspartate oxidase
VPSPETRAHLWRDAGVVRRADGLRTLLDDPHPLARIVGECALLREESRGGHLRSDFPQTDPALDGQHVVIRAGTTPVFESWV